MRALLVFLACFLPLGVLLLLFADEQGASQLPDQEPWSREEPVLSGADLADAHGVAPFAGKLRRLEDVDLRIVEDGYFKFYIRLGRMRRTDGQPRLEEVRAAIFDPPQEGQPRLRLTLLAPYIAGDLRQLLHAPQGSQRLLRLEGGVVARDPAGATVAEVERLDLDLTARTLASADPVLLNLTDNGLVVRGIGFFADLQARTARLEKDVVATADSGGRRFRLSCAGAATIEELAHDDSLRVRLGGKARIEHEFGAATCDEMTAEIARSEDGRADLRRATLEGNVRLQLDPKVARGLDRLEMDAVTIESDGTLVCRGPIRAVWRGHVSAFGLGERTLDLKAGEAILMMRRDDDARLEVEEVRLAGGFAATDRDGGGNLSARMVTFVRDGNTLEARGDVRAKTPDGQLRADFLRASAPEQERYEAVLLGEKEVAYVADGKLGPFGEAARGTLRISCRGPLRLTKADGKQTFSARDGVVATVDDLSRIECESLDVEQAEKELVFDASRNVLLREASRDATIRCDRVRYAEGAAHIEGSPAQVELEQSSVRAKKLLYRDDQTFEASGDVAVSTPLRRGEAGERWEFRCDVAKGDLAAGGDPKSVAATGHLSAEGPGGQRVSGERFEYRAEDGRARLTGNPARLRRGAGLVLEAEQGFDIGIKDGEIASATSLGKARIEYTDDAKKPKVATFQRWRVTLRGPAVLDGDRVVVKEGGDLEALDDKGALALRAQAAKVVVLLARDSGAVRASTLTGSGGITIESFGTSAAKVSADRLEFEPGAQRVDIYGKARVQAKGWAANVHFDHVVFTIEEKGIDLKRASGIEVR